MRECEGGMRFSRKELIPVGATLFLNPDEQLNEGDEGAVRVTTGAVHCCRSHINISVLCQK